MTDVLLPPTDPDAPTAAYGALPGMPGFEGPDPDRRTPPRWGLIIGLIVATMLVAGFVGGGLLFLSAAGAGAAAGSCGGG
jgi:hypothetical protein